MSAGREDVLAKQSKERTEQRKEVAEKNEILKIVIENRDAERLKKHGGRGRMIFFTFHKDILDHAGPDTMGIFKRRNRRG